LARIQSPRPKSLRGSTDSFLSFESQPLGLSQTVSALKRLGTLRQSRQHWSASSADFADPAIAYVTITPVYRLEASPRLKEDYRKGGSYYPLHGSSVSVPARGGRRAERRLSAMA
jgi:hypothetical protein